MRSVGTFSTLEVGAASGEKQESESSVSAHAGLALGLCEWLERPCHQRARQVKQGHPCTTDNALRQDHNLIADRHYLSVKLWPMGGGLPGGGSQLNNSVPSPLASKIYHPLASSW